MTYRTVRYYKNTGPKAIINTGLTLEEAQEHCSDTESSSTTCKRDVGKEHTQKYGPWFDGYEKENE